jgi:hypothetical protein
MIAMRGVQGINPELFASNQAARFDVFKNFKYEIRSTILIPCPLKEPISMSFLIKINDMFSPPFFDPKSAADIDLSIGNARPPIYA